MVEPHPTFQFIPLPSTVCWIILSRMENPSYHFVESNPRLTFDSQNAQVIITWKPKRIPAYLKCFFCAKKLSSHRSRTRILNSYNAVLAGADFFAAGNTPGALGAIQSNKKNKTSHWGALMINLVSYKPGRTIIFL